MKIAMGYEVDFNNAQALIDDDREKDELAPWNEQLSQEEKEALMDVHWDDDRKGLN